MKILFYILLIFGLSISGFILFKKYYDTNKNAITFNVSVTNPENNIDKNKPKIAILLISNDDIESAKRISNFPDATASVVVFNNYANSNEIYSIISNSHREIIVNINMEPDNYPNNNPGPDTLLIGITDVENVTTLNNVLLNHLSSTGIINIYGNKFISSTKDLNPVLDFLKNKGLIFINASNTNVNKLKNSAKKTNTIVKICDIFIDNKPSEDELKDALKVLEAKAKNEGSAIGLFRYYDDRINIMESWAKEIIQKSEIRFVKISSI